MKRRVPTPDELRLWAAVATSVAPLGGRPPIDAPAAESPPARKSAAAPAPPAILSRRVATPPARNPPLAAIDRRTVSRISRGIAEIDARIDLHGMTQQAAHGRLVRFLREAQGDGARLVLVITGKGRPAAEPGFGEERGVLRRAAPLWLGAAELRPYVVGFGEAAPAHGGSGALYVRIRRARG
jgi:DNA-nicking Smr family endonuclease